MEHVGVPHQKKINEELLRIHKANNIPYVITNDNHYVNQEDHSAHELLMCLQTNSNINDPHRFKFDDDNYHIKSTEEMYEQWGELTEGLRNTLVIAEKCNIELDFLPNGTILIISNKTLEKNENINIINFINEIKSKYYSVLKINFY